MFSEEAVAFFEVRYKNSDAFVKMLRLLLALKGSFPNTLCYV
jgi:hypothetical protein